MFMPSDKIHYSDIVHDMLCYKFDTEDQTIDNLIKMKSFVDNLTNLFFDNEDLSGLDVTVHPEELGVTLKLNNDFTQDLFATVLYEIVDDDDVDDDDEDDDDEEDDDEEDDDEDDEAEPFNKISLN